MRRAYMKPALQVIRIQQRHIICGSGWDVIGPGQPNQPAGSRRRSVWDEWDDCDEWGDELGLGSFSESSLKL